jgi:hypothetical protein
MNIQDTNFAAFVGIDWAHSKHDICLQAAESGRMEHRVVPHTAEDIDAWSTELGTRFGHRPIAVCVELAKGPLISALQKHDFFVLFPVDPSTLAKYRTAWSPSGKKNDVTDAALALEIVVKHIEHQVARRATADRAECNRGVRRRDRATE